MTYSELTALLELYLHRTDLAPNYPGIFALVRERLGKDARLLVMETTLLGIPTDGVLALPSDFLEARTVLQAQARGQRALQYREPAAYAALLTAYSSPKSYTIDGGNLLAPGTAQLELRYYARPSALANPDDTNPVLTEYPSLYLQCALMYCQQAIQDSESQQVASAMYGTELAKANDSDEMARRSGDAPAMVAM